MLAYFGATPTAIAPPGGLSDSLPLGLYDLSYPAFRISILGVARRGRALRVLAGHPAHALGMVVRAGVDDRAMTSALGVNVQRVFAAAFFVGSALAGLGGVFAGPRCRSRRARTTSSWSARSSSSSSAGWAVWAAPPSARCCSASSTSTPRVYLPAEYSNLSPAHLRPARRVLAVGRPASSGGTLTPRRIVTRGALVVLLALVPLLFSAFFTSQVASTSL